MIENPLEAAEQALAEAAATDKIHGTAARSAAVILSHRPLVNALRRLRDYHLGHVMSVAQIIWLALKLDEIVSASHERLLSGTQDEWKKEIPPGSAREFKRTLRQLIIEVRRLK